MHRSFFFERERERLGIKSTPNTTPLLSSIDPRRDRLTRVLWGDVSLRLSWVPACLDSYASGLIGCNRVFCSGFLCFATIPLSHRVWCYMPSIHVLLLWKWVGFGTPLMQKSAVGIVSVRTFHDFSTYFVNLRSKILMFYESIYRTKSSCLWSSFFCLLRMKCRHFLFWFTNTSVHHYTGILRFLQPPRSLIMPSMTSFIPWIVFLPKSSVKPCIPIIPVRVITVLPERSRPASWIQSGKHSRVPVNVILAFESRIRCRFNSTFTLQFWVNTITCRRLIHTLKKNASQVETCTIVNNFLLEIVFKGKNCV